MLSVRDLHLSIGQRPLAQGLGFDIAPGELVALTGASGAGKSTLLNWLVGDLDPAFSASGELWLDGIRCDALPTPRRRIGLLFQDDLLFPHMSVGHNLAFALPAEVRGSSARRARVEQALNDMGLAGFHDRDPATLSGGQKARVSLMRALLAAPRALLLDEPYNRLDPGLRAQFRAFVLGQIERQGIPTLLVTHDLADVPTGARILSLDHASPAPRA